MTPLWRALKVIWTSGRSALLRGLALSILVLAMGAALLGVSGWFITAAGAAGMAGIGIAFDVFRPSAAIRLLALGRAASRYGERLLTHDATLRALAALRVDVLRRHLRLPFGTQLRLRVGPSLTRVTADVDALDGLLLRLVLPGIALGVTHLGVAACLVWLIGWSVALPILVGQGVGAVLILIWAGLRTLSPSTHAERATQRLRVGLIDLLRGQADAAVFGRLVLWRKRLLKTATRTDWHLAKLEKTDERAEAALAICVTVCVSILLLVGNHLVQSGLVTPAAVAIGIFTALGIQEAAAPLRRGVAELGRMRDAASRLFDAPVSSQTQSGPGTLAAPLEPPSVTVNSLAFQRPGASVPVFTGVGFQVRSGETCALTGASGRGKSTVFHLIAGLEPPTSGTLLLMGRPLDSFSEPDLRRILCLVPQRSALLSGSILENLGLARADVLPEQAEAVLRAVCLWDKVQEIGGLHAQLGEGGAGLSGGESRRLILARALLRQPKVLLLDEPTEGLDQQMATHVLQGIRSALPDAAIIIAAHRKAEIAYADYSICV